MNEFDAFADVSLMRKSMPTVSAAGSLTRSSSASSSTSGSCAASTPSSVGATRVSSVSSPFLPSTSSCSYISPPTPPSVSSTLSLDSSQSVNNNQSQCGSTPAASMPASTSTGSSSCSSSSSSSGRYYNPVVMSFIRDDWIKQQLHLRQSSYTQIDSTSVFCGTWNVNGKKPFSVQESSKLLHWIRKGSSPNKNTGDDLGADHSPPDIIALGFQEIVDLNAVNVVVNNLSAQRSAAWEEAITNALNQHFTKSQYRLVLEKHLVGILLVVFVKVNHVDFVKEIQGATAGVGIMGMMGNKGGVAIRMSFYDTTICFVCAHLAAHRENVAGRNADFMNIMSKIEFVDPLDDVSVSTPPAVAATTAASSAENRFNVNEPAICSHDFVFWLGDLNYRITEELSTEECFRRVDKRDVAFLLQYDQLNVERAFGNVFQGFEEGALAFLPTYKFQAGTDIYDRRPEKKIRAPAWCDRVLYKSRHPDQVSLRSYDSVMALDLSDHKPVLARFDIQVKKENPQQKNEIIKQILIQLDKWENDNLPKVNVLQKNGLLCFDQVRFQQKQYRKLRVENTGNVVAHFRFIPKLEDTRICKPFVNVKPAFGMIPPKQVFEIDVEVLVTREIAQRVTAGLESLEDTMILRIENGRDYFLLVTVDYQNCCFGYSLEQLVALTDPIRSCSPKTVVNQQRAQILQETSTDEHEKASASPLSPKQAQRIPKELWRMVDDLFHHSMDQKNLFLEGGIDKEMVALREALDTGTAFPTHSCHSMAEVLLSWLQSLRGNVVPLELMAAINGVPENMEIVYACSAIANNGTAGVPNAQVAGHTTILRSCCRMLLDGLPPVRYNVFIYLTAFLKEVLKHQASNKITAAKLAFVFSQCLLCPLKTSSTEEQHECAPHKQSASLLVDPFFVPPTDSRMSTTADIKTTAQSSISGLSKSNMFTQSAIKLEKLLLFMLSSTSV